MLNPFFLQGSKSEQNLVQSLINEQIKMYGVEVHYLPRKYMTERTVIKEVVQSKFDDAYPIEAYVSTYDGYGGQGTLLSKFGIQEIDDLTLVISKERFESYITPLLEGQDNVKLASRPKEGDLIYFPLGDRIFEIKYVEHESPFYQLQQNYVYELRCELFRYEDEVIDTDVEQIDDNIIGQGYIKTFTVVGSGSSASAITNIVDGGVNSITLTNRGFNYTTAPDVTFSSSPVSGGTAIGIASMVTGIKDFCDPDGSKYRVQSVQLVNTGFGYTVAPKVVFIGDGEDATATATIADGIVGVITVTDGGSGYINPTVTFVGDADTEATAVANVTAGVITSIYITNAGAGYTETPTVQVSAPYGDGTGAFKFNEIVVGSSSGTTGRVNTWNATTNKLELSNIDGDFLNGEIVVGQESQAQYQILTTEVFDVVDPYAQNDVIETEGDAIRNFTESNPFGNP